MTQGIETTTYRITSSRDVIIDIPAMVKASWTKRGCACGIKGKTEVAD